MESLRSLIGRVGDEFAYVVCYSPDFPEEDQENLDSAFNGLITGVSSILKRTKNSDALHWLRLSLNDLNIAFIAYRQGDNLKGERFLGSARSYFDDSVVRKSIRGQVDYIIDSEGNVE